MGKNNIDSAEARSTSLLPEQEKILQNYLRDNALNGLPESTCENKYKAINLFARTIKKPFN